MWTLGPSAERRPSLLPLWPRVVMWHADAFCYLPRAPRLEGNLPPLLRSLLQYKLHSSEHFSAKRGACCLGDAVFARAPNWVDGTSSLLDGLRKNVSFSFSIVVIVCVLVCPASEVVVLAEEHLQGFGDHVRRRSISDRSQLEMEHGSCRIAEAVLIVRRS